MCILSELVDLRHGFLIPQMHNRGGTLRCCELPFG